MISDYVKYRRFPLILLMMSLSVFWLLQFLYRAPLESVGYTTLINLTLTAMILIPDYFHYRLRRRQLKQLEQAWLTQIWELPYTQEPMEKAYQDLILKQREILEEEKEKQLTASRQREELVTLWMHQIKLPLAAMSLIIEDLDPEKQPPAAHLNELRLALMRTEQYAQTALKTIQIENLKNDLVMETCDLKEICAEVIRKQALVFILKKLTLNFEAESVWVTTDRKWLAFMLEQLLSNSLKYTQQGSITISLIPGERPRLILSDTGCGIAEEDLPRIFERGYTGYNGHQDFKASGIGLFLCRKVSSTLGLTLNLQSHKNEGTQVTLEFPPQDSFYYRGL